MGSVAAPFIPSGGVFGYPQTADPLYDAASHQSLTVNGPAPSGDTSGATDSAAVATAIATLGGAAGTVRLPAKTGVYYFNQVLTLGKGQWIEAAGGSYDLQGYGVIFRYVGAPTPTPFVDFSAAGCGARFISFDCNSLAVNGLKYLHGEKQGYEDIGVSNFTGYGVTIGDGIANNNGFSGKGSLYLRGLAGSTPLIINAASTDDISLDIVDITPSNGVVAAMAQCVQVTNSCSTTIQSLTVVDPLMTGYAISLAGGGSLGISSLISECAQVMTTANQERAHGTYILSGRVGVTAPQAGQFTFDFGDSGNVSRYFLGPLTMTPAIGASASIRVNGCVLYDGGLDWQDSSGNTVAPNFTFINGGTLSSAVFGIVRPPWAPYELTALTLGLANRTRYYRVTESGPVTKVRVYIGTSSGNICVSVHRNTGSGLSAAPGTRIGTTGSIACPAAGQNDISLGATVGVNAGDWIGIGADNNVVTFLGLAGAGVFGEGMAAVQNTFPAPPVPGVGYATDVLLTFVGVP